MYFKRLEIVGFKSFMDKAVLNFEPGVTAIVGPNGCGKSNIFDSIRWVLGEQSIKSLRGSTMEDVIFNGTDTKQPLGMAEVSLTFDNSQKQFPVEHDEVLITRRLFRSGESEYLLNKAQVRLKDIQELLLGTGIGAESYSIIAQGKIDLILSSRPEDRRQVFDEASGITKYKSQKREALRRLEETEQNLLRINDIITEVKRSIGYLERQANKARRYQASFADLKNKEINLAFLQKNSLQAQRDALAQEVTRNKEQEEALHTQIREQEAGIAQRNEEIGQLKQELDRIRESILSLENQIQSNTQHVTFNHERIKELEGTRVYLESQISQTRERLTQDEENLRTFKAEYVEFKNSYEIKSTALKENELQLSGIVEAVKKSEEAIVRAKRSILDLAARQSQAKNELSELSSKQQVQLARQKRLELEKAKVFEERKDVESNLTGLNLEVLALEQEYTRIAGELETVKSAQETKARSLAEVAATIEELEKKKLTLESQREFLEKLKNQYEDITESLNAEIRLDRLPSEKINGLVVKIKDETLSGAEVSGNNFIIHGEAKPIDLDARNVKEKIEATEQELVGLRGTKSELEAAIQELNATRELLSLKRQDQEVALANKRTVQQTVVEQFTKIKTEEEIIVLELQDVSTEMAESGKKFSLAQEHLSAVEAENKAVELLIIREQEHINLNSKIKEEVLVVIAQVKTEVESLSKQLAAEDANLRMLEEAVSVSCANILNLENKVKEGQHRQEGLSLQIEDLKAKISQAERDIVAQKQVFAETDARFRGLADSISGIVSSIEEKRVQLENVRETVYATQMQEKDLEFKYQSMKERLHTAYKIDLDTIETLFEVNLQEVPVTSPSPETAPAENTAPPATEASAPDQPSADASAQPLVETQPSFVREAMDETALAAQIERLKEKVDSYGTVNLVAIEEYDELKKRYDFLTQQQTDLVTAKESLQEAIRKINHTTRKMFMETFERVREEFRGYFKLLFNGGDAQIYLIDESDPLETGIEIICRPPGKKLQNVLLLSGGEKALSAIALIFAIFKVKPAPFCVLDEIDAPLDESNVDRFGRLLAEFATTSQFIVITHNKRTIANADVMYGITMQESGVSKIVSVKFSQNKPAADKDKTPEPVAA